MKKGIKQLSLDIPTQLHSALKKLAIDRKCSMTTIVTELIKNITRKEPKNESTNE